MLLFFIASLGLEIMFFNMLVLCVGTLVSSDT